MQGVTNRCAGPQLVLVFLFLHNQSNTGSLWPQGHNLFDHFMIFYNSFYPIHNSYITYSLYSMQAGLMVTLSQGVIMPLIVYSPYGSTIFTWLNATAFISLVWKLMQQLLLEDGIYNIEPPLTCGYYSIYQIETCQTGLKSFQFTH